MTTFKSTQDLPILGGRIFLPLQGPTGVRPKAPAIGAWQSPGYRGADYLEARVAHTQSPSCWYGLRCDGLVVIDCDCREAADRWQEISSCMSWIRKTPRGFHFIYEQVEGSPDAPYADVFGEESHIDIRAGRTSQIVYFAPNYKNLTEPATIKPFDAAWLGDRLATNVDRSVEEEWQEMPFGRGNNVMTAIAGAMRKQGMHGLTIAKCLGAINRITMTESPMHIEEIVQIAQSVARYTAKPDIDIEVGE